MPYLAHKIRLNPHPPQETTLRQMVGTSRFIYNWALASWKEKYAAGEKVSEHSLRKELTQLKKTDELSWVAEQPAAVSTNTVRNLGVAFKGWFRNLKKGDSKGFPKFKKHGVSESANPWDGGRINVQGKRIRIPNLGWVRMREELRFQGRIIQGVVSKDGDQWYVSITVEVAEVSKPRLGSGDVGIDLGCKELAVLSSGRVFEGLKPFRTWQDRLAKAQRIMSRRVKGSGRWLKAKRRVQSIHRKIRNIRADYLHKMTTEIIRTFDRICLEDLNVKEMIKLRTLAKPVLDQAFYAFRSMLEYKAKLYDSTVYFVDRYFPSSKLCSCCGNKKDSLSLSERTFACGGCGVEIDRDLNAAINLENQIPRLARELTLVESNLAGA